MIKLKCGHDLHIASGQDICGHCDINRHSRNHCRHCGHSAKWVWKEGLKKAYKAEHKALHLHLIARLFDRKCHETHGHSNDYMLTVYELTKVHDAVAELMQKIKNEN